ncbi:MAG: PD-(D/E)XK nuclease family protein [Deltaproteobacteria bacterium]|nr:PD-(D/E)XK nuclease family protein [Deltaproteobacteria bacterium]
MAQVKSFASSAALQDYLLQESGPDTLIIIPHQRLARQIWSRQRQQNLASGRAAWEPLPCLTLGAWWRELYRQLWRPESPAPAMKRWALWLRALEAGPAIEGVQLDFAWARGLDEAYDTLARHQLPLTAPQFGDSPLTAWRRQVTRIFEELLKEDNLLAPVQMADILLQALDAGRLRLPRQILAAGLDMPAPLEEAWLAAVARHTKVVRLQVRGNPETVRHAWVFANAAEELEWVAAELVRISHTQAAPLHRVAVTSPVMDEYAPRLRRILGELLGPEEQENGWAYNFSAGPRLADTPFWAAALLPLRFAALGEHREDLVALLCSPYYGAFKEQRSVLAQWDRVFREGRLNQGWSIFLRAVEGKFRADGRLLQTLGQAFAALSGNSRPIQQWLAGLRESWRLLGFPGGLNGQEALQHRRLLDLLGHLSQALENETLSAAQFLEWLSHGAREVRLPGPGVQEAGVQVLGLLEMRGLDFDRVFCLGLNSGSLPAPPRPLVLLSPEERQKVLGGTYASQHDFAANLYANILGCAPRLTLTRPHLVNDEEQVGTPLWPGRWQEAPNWKPVLSRPQAAWLLAAPVRAAFTVPRCGQTSCTSDEPINVALPPELSISQLQTALACPGRFLFEVLLGIQDLPDIEAGIPPPERGSLLHKAVALFVKRFQEVLAERGWQDDEAARILEESVRELLGPNLSDLHWQAELHRWLGNGDLCPGLLPAWLNLEKERYLQGWRWVEAELDFQGLSKPGWPFALKGRIDRLDCRPEGCELMVWDYKSGAIPAANRIFEQLEEFQLPGYLAAVKQGLVEGLQDILHHRAGFICLKSVRDRDLKHQDFGRSARHWEEVLQVWGNMVEAAARRLKNGDFRPDPYPAPVAHKLGACEYCPYPLLCGFSMAAGEDAEGEEA